MLISDFLMNEILSPEWEPIIFLPEQEPREILCQLIECIRVVCLMPDPEKGPQAPNRWKFYLSTSEKSSRAIMLECKPHYWEKSTILDSGCKARIVFKEMSTLAPYNANKSFILDVRSGLTVGDLHGLIVQHDRHKYEFDSGLHNDRFWVADQINLFTRHGVFTNQDEVVELNRQMRKRWPSQAPAPLELEKGAYYG